MTDYDHDLAAPIPSSLAPDLQFARSHTIDPIDVEGGSWTLCAGDSLPEGAVPCVGWPALGFFYVESTHGL